MGRHSIGSTNFALNLGYKTKTPADADRLRLASWYTSQPMKNVFEVMAYLPATVALTKRTTKDTITIRVQGGDKPGRLVISRGTVEWWPEGSKSKVHRGHWAEFAVACETMKVKNSTKRSRKPKK